MEKGQIRREIDPIPGKGQTRPMKRILEAIVIIAIIALDSLWLRRSMMFQYDFFDMSAFMDAGYRVMRGQEIYTDFYYVAGPMHLWMHAFFYKIFGFTKAAVLAHLLSVNTIALLSVYAIARKRLGARPALAVLALTACSFYTTIAHPWYDQNAAMWFLIAFAIREFSRSPGAAFFAGFFAGISILTKTNVGLAGSLVILAMMFRTPKAVFYCLGGLCIGTVWPLLATGILDDFIVQTLFQYNPWGRLKNAEKITLISAYSPYTLTLLFTVYLVLRKVRNEVVAHLLLLSLMGLFATFTTSVIVQVYLCLVGLISVFIFLSARRLGKQERYLMYLVLAVFANNSIMMSVDPHYWVWHRSTIENTHTMKNEPLEGWRANPELGEGVDAAVEKIKSLPEGQLLVFPDATVIYGLTGREPFKPAPFIFHLGKMPAPGKQADAFRNAVTSSPPKWILLHNQTELDFCDMDKLLHWLRLDQFIQGAYTPIWSHGEFYLVELKAELTEKLP